MDILETMLAIFLGVMSITILIAAYFIFQFWKRLFRDWKHRN